MGCKDRACGRLGGAPQILNPEHAWSVQENSTNVAAYFPAAKWYSLYDYSVVDASAGSLVKNYEVRTWLMCFHKQGLDLLGRPGAHGQTAARGRLFVGWPSLLSTARACSCLAAMLAAQWWPCWREIWQASGASQLLWILNPATCEHACKSCHLMRSQNIVHAAFQQPQYSSTATACQADAQQSSMDNM